MRQNSGTALAIEPSVVPAAVFSAALSEFAAAPHPDIPTEPWPMTLPPEERLAIWNGLLDGTFALAQAADKDGWRFLQVKDKHSKRHRKSSAVLKRRILRHLLTGVSNKYIAIELELAASTVDFHLKNAVTDLGFVSRNEMVRVLCRPRQLAGTGEPIIETAVHTPTAMMAFKHTFAGKAAIVLAYPLPPIPSFPQLTQTEAELAGRLLAGASNQAIAQERGTSKFTVANQVASIFRKLGVHSRFELAGRVANG